ncbi:8575_t:CDS:1 [Funneliformis caledonium]|uniref:8575_t:CDS:1 n=1 Tax=Funneliformis caledonium TaxID=1117310 RepID=A0A9N9GMS4_9GLOM|nr:8575_t:CDS:1 [Funneliformis caledonium]
MAPDILMVQHVSERNVAKLSEPEEKFRIALQEALKVAEEQDIEMGIFNTKCLHILDERIKKGQLLKQFRPFKNGATAYAPPSEQYHEDVVNLYESILADCKNSRRKIEFSEWNSLIQGYWRAVSLENFAVHFKNIKEIYEFIDLGKRITKVKEAISRAFLKHEEKIMQEIRSKLQNWSPDDRANENSRLRNECLKLIESGLEDVLNCDNNSNCEECKKANKERVELEDYLKEKNNEKTETETKQTIENYIKLNRQSVSDKLTRMLSAIIIRKGLSSESLEIINRHLEDIIRNMPSRGFPDHERKRKIEEIWNALRFNILSKDKPIPVERLIDEDVNNNYKTLPVDLHYKYKNGIYPDLSKCKAYKPISYNALTSLSQCLEKKDVHDLQGKLDNLADLIFKDRTSQHFYPGIVNDLKKVIDMTIVNFQKPRSTFYSDLKWNIHLYALLKFKPKMKKFQDDWEKENSPLGILDQKKEEYLKIIDTRLQYGHSLVSEGHIVGDYLLRVIHKKAMKAGNSERVRAVSDIAWMTSSETVRLKYFEELAEQVQKGDKAAAIRHFSIPEYSIKNWFIRTVNSIKSGNPEQKFKETFNAEFERALQEIRNCKNFEEIKVYVNNYMTQVDNVDYKLDLKHNLTKDGNLKLFQRTIEKELENKGNGRYSNPEPFQDPSDDKSIMKRLGCTEACHWCGALCWGSRDHHENSDTTKVHHTSHQPRGLTGTTHRDTCELRAMPCHKMTDDWYVWYHGKEDATIWSDAIARDFSDWKFEAHCNQIFNDLMCWFFEKLHHDLAAKWGSKPAPYSEMRDHGCLSLNYDSIISTIRTKF